MTIWFEFNGQLKNKCILQKALSIYVSYKLAKVWVISDKIFRNKVCCILDFSINYLSTIQAAFRDLHDIVQGESKVLNWKQTRNWLWLWKNKSLLSFSLTHKCRCSLKMFAWPSAFRSLTLTSSQSLFAHFHRFILTNYQNQSIHQ